MEKDKKTEFGKRVVLNDILQETEESLKIFVTSIKTGKKNKR